MQTTGEHADGLRRHSPLPDRGAAAHEGWPHPGDRGGKVRQSSICTDETIH